MSIAENAQSQVLPKELRLTAPPTMPQARTYLFKQSSTLSSYTGDGGSNLITINLPRLQRSYLTKDSYLKFKLAISASGKKYSTPCFDVPGAYGLIDKIEVYDYLGSTLLESTSGHGQLMALLMDLSKNPSEMQNHYGVIDGTTGPDLIPRPSFKTGPNAARLNPPPAGYLGFAAGDGEGYVYSQPPRYTSTNITHGKQITYFDGADVASSAPVVTNMEFAIPIFSFLGLLSQKYAPLHNGYTIQITLNQAVTAFGCTGYHIKAAASSPSTVNDTIDVGPGTAGTITYNMTNVEFACQILELSPIAEQMLASSTGGQPLIIPSKAYRNYVGNVNEKSSSFRLDLNLNVASLTNIMWIMRDANRTSNILYRSLSERCRNFLQSWYFQYGSSMLPQTSGIMCRSKAGDPCDTFTEAYVELLKSRHGFNLTNHDTLITKEGFTFDHTENWAAANGPADNAVTTYTNVESASFLQGPTYQPLLCTQNICPRGQFAAGLDLELVPGRANDIVAGLNTNGMNTSIYATFDSTAAANPTTSNQATSSTTGTFVKAMRVDAWCEYDSFINVLPGVATTVSF